MRKGLLAALAATLFATVALSGCMNGGGDGEGAANTENGRGETASEVTVNPAGTLPITSEKVTLRVLVRSNPLVENFATNEFTKWLEEQTNVHIEWEVAPVNEFKEKLNLVLVSGDLPDVIMDMEVSSTQQVLYGDQGLFVPINDLIDEYAPNVKKLLEEDEAIALRVTAPNGNIYDVPQVNICFHCQYSQKMWVYKPWLDKLGLDIPTTTEQFYEMLVAFKTQDPNGNGKADEIPLVGSRIGSGWNAQVDKFLMKAFVYNNGEDRLILNDGKVDVVYNKPEWKEGLKYMAKLHAEGLLAPESFTQDEEQLRKLTENPEAALIGAAPGGFPGIFGSMEGRGKDFVSIPPLKGPNGLQVSFFDAFGGGRGGQYIITSAAKYPEVAVRLADFLYTEEVTRRAVEGRPGSEWNPVDPSSGKLGLDGQPATWEPLVVTNVGDGVQNVHWAQTGPTLRDNAYRNSQYASPDNIEVMLYNETKQNYEPYGVEIDKILPPLIFDEQQSAELADIGKALTDYVNEMLARFVLGDADVEREWDSYLKNLESKKLDRYLEIYQEAYDYRYGS